MKLALRSRLEKQPTDLRQNTSYFGDRILERVHFVTAYVRSAQENWLGARATESNARRRLQRRRNGRFCGGSRRRSFFLRTKRTACATCFTGRASPYCKGR